MSQTVSPDPDSRGAWPALPTAEWKATRDALRMWLQVWARVRLAKAPMVNHWWHVPLYVPRAG
jgi:hypothetical protein